MQQIPTFAIKLRRGRRLRSEWQLGAASRCSPKYRRFTRATLSHPAV